MNEKEIRLQHKIHIENAYINLYIHLKDNDTDFHDFAYEYGSEQAGNGGEVVSDVGDYEDSEQYQELVESFMERLGL